MITVKARLDADYSQLDMEGHAAFHPGNDIVCAGASAIVNALAGWLLNSPDMVRGEPEIRLDSGHAHIAARGGQAVHEAFKQALCGLCNIQMAYPKNISLQLLDCRR